MLGWYCRYGVHSDGYWSIYISFGRTFFLGGPLVNVGAEVLKTQRPRCPSLGPTILVQDYAVGISHHGAVLRFKSPHPALIPIEDKPWCH